DNNTRKMESIPLTAGEEAEVKSNGHILKQDKPQVAKSLAWRQRQLDFSHAALQQVVEEFNRYNRLQIRIEDPLVRMRVINGVFSADEPEALLGFLAQEPDLSVQRNDSGVIIYSRRGTGSTASIR